MERFGDSLNVKLRGKNCATFYSETSYVTAMAVMLKKLCLAIIKLLLLKSHAFFSLQLANKWEVNEEYRLRDFSA